jgi:hypothetical protein
VDSLEWTDEPHPRFPGQGHILSAGGDALSVQSPAVEKSVEAIVVSTFFVLLF